MFGWMRLAAAAAVSAATPLAARDGEFRPVARGEPVGWPHHTGPVTGDAWAPGLGARVEGDDGTVRSRLPHGSMGG